MSEENGKMRDRKSNAWLASENEGEDWLTEHEGEWVAYAEDGTRYGPARTFELLEESFPEDPQIVNRLFITVVGQKHDLGRSLPPIRPNPIVEPKDLPPGILESSDSAQLEDWATEHEGEWVAYAEDGTRYGPARTFELLEESFPEDPQIVNRLFITVVGQNNAGQPSGRSC